jgi:hypothetical protein
LVFPMAEMKVVKKVVSLVDSMVERRAVYVVFW